MFEKNNANHAIHCSVHDCRYHNGSENYCSLAAIEVAAHEKKPKDERCVDCCSFQCRHDDMNC